MRTPGVGRGWSRGAVAVWLGWTALACGFAPIAEFDSNRAWNGVRPQNDARLVTRELLTLFATMDPEGDRASEPHMRCLAGPGPFVTTHLTLRGEIRGRRAPWYEGPWEAGDPAWGWDPGAAALEALSPLGMVRPISECRAERNEGAPRAPHLYLRVRSIAFDDVTPESIRAYADVEIVTEGRTGRFFYCEIRKKASMWEDIRCQPERAPSGHPGG